jgi:molybdate transport system substrate-binding protein
MGTERRMRLAIGVCALALLLVVSATGCAQQPTAPAASAPTTTAPTELNISAAASLKSLAQTTAPAFEKANDAKAVFNFGASGALQKQIEAGSPCDVFVSASPKQVDALIAESVISADTTVTFASNDLVVIVPKGNPKGIAGPKDLAKAVKLSTGDPLVAPVGTSAQEWLTNLGMWDQLKPKFVLAQNAPQNVDYVARGEVDAGISFASDAHGRSDVEVAYTVPAGQFKTIRYVAGVVKATKHDALAKKYTAFLTSPEFQRALVAAGFKAAP